MSPETKTIIAYILANKSVRNNIYYTCFEGREGWLQTKRLLRFTFEEYITLLNEPLYIKNLLLHSLKHVDWLVVAMAIARKMKGEKKWHS